MALLAGRGDTDRVCSLLSTKQHRQRQLHWQEKPALNANNSYTRDADATAKRRRSRAQWRWYGRAAVVFFVLFCYGWNLRASHLSMQVMLQSDLPQSLHQDWRAVIVNKETQSVVIAQEEKLAKEEFLKYKARQARRSKTTTQHTIVTENELPKRFKLRSAWARAKEALSAFLSIISPAAHVAPVTKSNKTQTLISTIFTMHHEWHPTDRQDRFPSVLDRIRIYTGEEFWLDRACQNIVFPPSSKAKVEQESEILHPSYVALSNGTVIIPSYMIRPINAAQRDDNEQQDGAAATTKKWSSLFSQLICRLRSSPLLYHGVSSEEDHHLAAAYENNDIVLSTKPRGSRNESNTVLALQRDEMSKCANETTHMYARYCQDALTLLDVADSLNLAPGQHRSSAADNSEATTTPPILVRFSDSETKWDAGTTPIIVDVPMFKKFRTILPSDRVLKERSTHTKGSSPSDQQITPPQRNVSFADICQDRSTVTKETPTHNADDPAFVAAAASREWEPFVWNLNSNRHFQHVRTVPYMDRPWYMKRNAAVWRGAMSGREAIQHKAVTTVEECHLVPRCRLVLSNLDQQHQLSTSRLQHSTTADNNVTTNGEKDATEVLPEYSLVDAKFATCVKGKDQEVGAIPIDSHPMATSPCANRLEVKQMLEYKAVIMLEGNDVASGLKWALFSQSVVLMPNPTRMTWALESWLEPWVHYVPLHGDLSNVEESMQWIIDNDAEAKKIAERATLFIYDLLYHPQAESDNEQVKRGLLQLYWSTFE
jgi:hypothetical protein